MRDPRRLLSLLALSVLPGPSLIRALTQPLVERLQTANEVACLVRGLRLLTLTVAALRRRLRLLQTLTEIGDVGADDLFGRIQPIGGRIAHLLLRLTQLLLDLPAAERIRRRLERARQILLIATTLERHFIEL